MDAGKLERIGRRQDGVVSVAQAVESGLSLWQISRRRAQGRYQRSRRRTVVFGGVPPTWRQAVRIAQLAAGTGVAISHSSVARLYGLEPGYTDEDCLEVSAVLKRKVRLEGVRAHRTRTWEEGDVIERFGFTVTSPLRLLIDLSSRLGVAGTGRLLDEMLRRKLATLQELADRLPTLRPAPGRSVRVLRLVLAQRWKGYDPGESTLEARLIRVIKRKKFPLPVQQHRIRDGRFKARLDFAYPDVKLFLEGDGFGFHSTASDLDNDSRRRNELVVRGWLPLTFTWRMRDKEIEATLARMYDRNTGTWTLPR